MPTVYTHAMCLRLANTYSWREGRSERVGRGVSLALIPVCARVTCIRVSVCKCMGSPLCDVGQSAATGFC